MLAGHELGGSLLFLAAAAGAATGQPVAGALLPVQGRGHTQTHQLEATAQGR